MNQSIKTNLGILNESNKNKKHIKTRDDKKEVLIVQKELKNKKTKQFFIFSFEKKNVIVRFSIQKQEALVLVKGFAEKKKV